MSVEASVADPDRFSVPSHYAAVAALLCGVHCALTPVVAGVLPFLALGSRVEWGALGLTVCVGGAAVFLGPSRGRMSVLLLIAMGIAVWSASLLGLLAPIPEAVSSPVGSLVFAMGMIQSARICRSGECDRCTGTTQTADPDSPMHSAAPDGSRWNGRGRHAQVEQCATDHVYGYLGDDRP